MLGMRIQTASKNYNAIPSMYSAHCHLYMLSVHNMEQETKRKDIYILYDKLSWLEITILLVINFYIYNSMFSSPKMLKRSLLQL
jgi:hypothetical protein